MFARMSQQALSLSRRLPRASKAIALFVALLSTALLGLWLNRLARGIPDTYQGQTFGGLFLNLYLLTSSAEQLVARPRVRVPLLVASIVCLLVSLYFIFGSRPAQA